MTRAVLLLLPAALACLGAAQAPKAPAAKPAPAKAAPARPAAAAGSFDAQNPNAFVALLEAAGAKAQASRREEDSVFIPVTSPLANFSMQFAGCTPQGRGCRAVLLDAALERSPATLAQVNAFNQTSVMCRVYQDKAGLPHVVYSAILFRSMTRDDATTHLQAWQGCLADARDFLKDPVGYLANAA
ncbi:MAG: YbjN domain-containing protein [Phenylobacterium sp.]|uniref:YbjN domain-containing protein n=1 Tax=Phenylobacterium sp. TaxID=1871053 RepID=UPI001A411472|nr:YbjN domain-containing protein [Phenylobacterium sp.]MBL8771113.1 YbjN domain-containing protein [Phenylobacterium sp.]